MGLASSSTGKSLKTELTGLSLKPESMSRNCSPGMWVTESTGVGLHSGSTGAWGHRKQSEVWGLTGFEVCMQPGSGRVSLEAKRVSAGLKARSTGGGVGPEATEAESMGMIMKA